MSEIIENGQGAYNWVCEFNLFKNPTILASVLKVMLGVAAGIVALLIALMIPDLANGYADGADVLEVLRFGGLLTLFFLVLTCVGYAVYGLMQGGKYCVVFTMDERGITHKQLPKQFKKAQVISGLNVLSGLASGSPAQVGSGLLVTTHDSTASDFSKVRTVRGSRRLRVIKVNEPFSKNQVYVDPADYDFVFGYIRDHCPHADVKG